MNVNTAGDGSVLLVSLCALIMLCAVWVQEPWPFGNARFRRRGAGGTPTHVAGGQQQQDAFA